MSALLQLGLTLASVTYASLLGGVAYLIRTRRADALTATATLQSIKDSIAEQRHTNERQSEWNEQTSRGFHRLTDDVEGLEDIAVRHSNRLRDDGRRLVALEKRLDAYDAWRAELLRRQILPLRALSPDEAIRPSNGDPA